MVGLLAVVLVVGSVISAILHVGLPGEETAAEHIITLAAFLLFALTGLVLVWRQPRNAIGWILFGIGGLPSLFAGFAAHGEHVLLETGKVDAFGLFGLWGNSWYFWLLLSLALVFLPLLFPDGRLPSRRWRPWAAIPTVAMVGMVALGMVAPTLSGQDVRELQVDNPIGIAGAPGVEEEAEFLFFGLLFGLGLGVLSIIIRFRRSRGVERQQLKWFFIGALLLPAIPAGEVLPESLSNFVLPVVLSLLPVAIGVAVLRYRLYEIDRVISRTVSYLLLTGALVGVYALGVLGVGALVPGERSDLLVAASTLAVAALFRPLRSRIQRIVDRRFNRARYDAARTLESFASRLRDEVEVDNVVNDLGTTVRTSFAPRSVAVWVQRAGP